MEARARSGGVPAVLAAVGVLVALVVGLVAGTWFSGREPSAIGDQARVPVAGAAELEAVRSEVARLAGELVRLREGLSLTAPAAVDDRELAQLGAAVEGLSDELTSAVREAGARVPVGEATPVGIEKRLAALERAVRERLVIVDKTAAARGLRIPLGEPDRPSLGSLWDRTNELDQTPAVVKEHMFWTFQDVLNRYGRPDEIKSHDDYLEWIYELPAKDDKFDFHFVDGLCTYAH